MLYDISYYCFFPFFRMSPTVHLLQPNIFWNVASTTVSGVGLCLMIVKFADVDADSNLAVLGRKCEILPTTALYYCIPRLIFVAPFLLAVMLYFTAQFLANVMAMHLNPGCESTHDRYVLIARFQFLHQAVGQVLATNLLTHRYLLSTHRYLLSKVRRFCVFISIRMAMTFPFPQYF